MNENTFIYIRYFKKLDKLEKLKLVQEQDRQLLAYSFLSFSGTIVHCRKNKNSMYKFKGYIHYSLIKSKQLNLTKKSRIVIKLHYYHQSSFWRRSLETSLAPLCIVLGLDNTDGVIAPGLGEVAHHNHGVLIGVVLQNVITTTIIIISTCNYYVPVISGV